MLRGVFLAVCVVAVVGTGGAHAAPEPTPEDVAEAKVRFEAGTNAFKAGRFRDALTEFQGGYLLTRNPGFLLNMAVCYRKMGENQQALTLFRDYLEEAPDSPRREEVEKQIRELEALVEPQAQASPEEVAEARLANGARDPAAPLAMPPQPEPASLPAPQPARDLASRAPPTPQGGPRVDAADEDDGVALVVAKRGSPTNPPRDEPAGETGGGRWWLWGGLALAAVAGLAWAVSASGDDSVSPALGVVDLR